MRTFVLLAALAAFTGLFQPPSALADALSDSCALVEALKTGGAEKGVGHLEEMASAWPAENREKLRSTLLPIFGMNQYAGGNIYLVADLPDDYREHWVWLQSAQGSPVFMRLSWMRGAPGLYLTNVDLDLGFKDSLARRPLLQQPARLSCPE